MSIRTYLVISYLALVLLLCVGMWTIADHFGDTMLARSLGTAETALKESADANAQVSERILTSLGEYVVRDKAQDVARELAYVLPKKRPLNYAQMRQDRRLRAIAVQAINTPEGQAGYTDLYDTRGEIILHPDRSAEGKNQVAFRAENPDALALLQRSFQEDVSGYYTSRDESGKERKRFAARCHVPGTSLIVGTVVNLDEFFLPTQEEINKASQQITARTRQDLFKEHEAIDLQSSIGFFITGLALCLVGGLGGVGFAAAISRPLRRLDRAVHQVGEGDFTVEVPEKGVREVMNLARSFNHLGEQLTDYMEKRDFIRDTFSRYVTQEVVKKLLESREALELGGETREVSMLMSDIRGFTALTADMTPQQVITFLNRYLGKMIEILTDYRAVIDEIMGDGILAFFGAPEPQEDHPVRAVACALQMQAAMDEINFLNEAEGLPHLEMGVGVNTGEVVVGNIGSERRTKYSVVGTPVNFTSRIEASALGGQVLISSATYRRVKDLVTLGDTLKVEMKGVPHPATLYEVLGITGPYNLHLRVKRETLVPLREKMGAHLYRLQEKIITGTAALAWITHLSETAAIIELQGELEPWEDVRLRLLDTHLAEMPGKIYAKVIVVQPGGGDLRLVTLRFTSVAPESERLIQQAIMTD
jgi:class 3 adenylate cyclase